MLAPTIGLLLISGAAAGLSVVREGSTLLCRKGDNADRTASTDDSSTNAGDVNSKDDVISDTISEDPVPNTGGMPLLGPVVSGLAFIGVGLLLFRSAVRRETLESDAPDGAEGVQLVLPVEILREAVESYAPYLQASGEMHDPVFGEPTQNGTPYHALCNAVLAGEDAGERKSAYADRAVRGLEAALDHIIDPGLYVEGIHAYPGKES